MKSERPVTQALTGHFELSTESGTFLGDTRVRLLEAIGQHGSIAAAARHVPLSYKAAWDAIDAMNNLADQPLVERSTGGRGGGGTVLTDHGRRVIAMYRAVEAEYQIALDNLSRRMAAEPIGDVKSFQRLLRRLSLRSSARNQFVGTVAALREEAVETEVRVSLDAGLEITAIVTRESAENLGLRVGREVIALVKSSSMLVFADPALRLSARNQLWGTVREIESSAVNAEVVIDLGPTRSAVAVLTAEALLALGLQVGAPACAAFKASSVILTVID